MSAIMPELVVRRPVYQQDDLHRLSQYTNPQKPLRLPDFVGHGTAPYVRLQKCLITSKLQWFGFHCIICRASRDACALDSDVVHMHLGKTIKNSIKNIEPKSCIRRLIPVIGWLPRYHFKRDLFGDLIAGITVAVMHIPQGMAYAILGNVPPITGIYMAFFPVLVYFIFGTSRHNSMGTFAVICMMTGKIVLTHSSSPVAGVDNSTDSQIHANLDAPPGHYSPVEVASAVCFMVALIQLAMYFLRLGVISSLLSETLVSGFTTAAAVHVLTSQIKDLFGLKLDKRKGIFKVLLTYYDIIKNIDNVNIVAMVISAVTIIAIVFNNEILKPRLAKRCSFPIPIEMIVVVLGTVISIYANLEDVYGIITVGHIPVGFPQPKLPPMDLLSDIILDSFVITMVSYTISMSMALIFAQKLNYDVDSNQELMAQGLGNLVGSFFLCMPFCASLSRSLIQQSVGGRTQLASLVSCGILLFVLLWIGPFFEPLPRCVLASIIVVALKGMLMQVKDFFRFLRLSHVDATIWLMTFFTVTIFDIEYGLLIGALLCLANLLTLSMRPYTSRLALVPGTELYLDTKRFKGTVEIPGIKIFHYCGGLNFASRQSFRKDVYRIAGIVPQKELLLREKAEIDTKQYLGDNTKKDGCENAAYDGDNAGLSAPECVIHSVKEHKLKVLVLDFSSVVHIDPAGVATLRGIVDDFAKIDVYVYITACSGRVYETMRKCNAAESKQDHFTMFPTVNDAVNFARHKNHIPPMPIWTATQTQPEENCISRLSSVEDIISTISNRRSMTNNQRNFNDQNLEIAQYGTFNKLPDKV